MNRLVVLAVSSLALAAFAGPEVEVECPAGMEFVKNKGCVAKIAAAPECPGGTRFDGKKCVAIIDTSCPAGMHFVAGTGCVAGKATAAAKTESPPPPPPRPEPTPAPAKEEDAKNKKGGTFQSGFSNRLVASCNGHDFEVLGRSKIIGAGVMLLTDGTKVGEEIDVKMGQTKNIEGKVGGTSYDLKVQQGMWGTRYTLSVNGKECKLGK
jgi:hypothetical protein